MARKLRSLARSPSSPGVVSFSSFMAQLVPSTVTITLGSGSGWGSGGDSKRVSEKTACQNLQVLSGSAAVRRMNLGWRLPRLEAVVCQVLFISVGLNFRWKLSTHRLRALEQALLYLARAALYSEAYLRLRLSGM